jgi:hypothetical protein
LLNKTSILIAAFASFFALPAVSSTTARAVDLCDISSLPKEIQVKLEKNYPDWQPEKLENLDQEDRSLWTKAHPNDCPGIAVGHFESKDELSYALLLVSKPDRNRLGLRIVAYSRSASLAPYIGRLIIKWDIGMLLNQDSDQVIATAPTRHYEEAIGPKKVDTTLDSILYETMEKGAILYYWKNGRYHELITSD